MMKELSVAAPNALGDLCVACGFSLNTFSFFSVTPLHVSFQSLINWVMCSSFDCNLFYSRRLGSQILTPLLACCGHAIIFALSCTVDMMSARVDAFTISNSFGQKEVRSLRTLIIR